MYLAADVSVAPKDKTGSGCILQHGECSQYSVVTVHGK